MGRPTFSFIDQGKDLGYTREREKEKKEKNRGKEGPGATSSFSDERVPLVVQMMMMRATPRRDVDGDGDGSMLWPYLPPAPHAGVASRSCRPVPSWCTAWSTDSPDRSRTGIRQHSASMPGAVGDVKPQVWPITVMGRVEACLLPSRCQKSDPILELSHL
jgi:hypothetical protein